jgi:hypothetical protein
MKKIVGFLTILFLGMPNVVIAGSPNSPEIGDATGDAAPYLDIVRVWLTNSSLTRSIFVNVQIDSLSMMDPVSNGDYIYMYRAKFNLTGYTTLWAGVNVGFQDTSAHPLPASTATGSGTYNSQSFADANVGTSAWRAYPENLIANVNFTLDRSTGVIVIGLIPRPNNPSPFVNCARITGLTFETLSASRPAGSQLLNTLAPPFWNSVDMAGPGKSYTINYSTPANPVIC